METNLFFGCYGNGTLVSDKSRSEYGDYKKNLSYQRRRKNPLVRQPGQAGQGKPEPDRIGGAETERPL